MDKTFLKKFILIVLVLSSFLYAGYTVAAVINVTLPGDNDTSGDPNPAGIVGNAYQFALMIGGLLAFGVIVYAGIKYGMASGNPSVQSDAKDRIVQALIGLLLLAGGGIILATIRPGFEVTGGGFSFPGLSNLSPVENTDVDITCGGIQYGSCPSGQTCKVMTIATGQPPSYNCVAGGGTPSGGNPIDPADNPDDPTYCSYNQNNNNSCGYPNPGTCQGGQCLP